MERLPRICTATPAVLLCTNLSLLGVKKQQIHSFTSGKKELQSNSSSLRKSRHPTCLQYSNAPQPTRLLLLRYKLGTVKALDGKYLWLELFSNRTFFRRYPSSPATCHQIRKENCLICKLCFQNSVRASCTHCLPQHSLFAVLWMNTTNVILPAVHYYRIYTHLRSCEKPYLIF